MWNEDSSTLPEQEEGMGDEIRLPDVPFAVRTEVTK
jgi:hypothetical protein